MFISYLNNIERKTKGITQQSETMVMHVAVVIREGKSHPLRTIS